MAEPNPQPEVVEAPAAQPAKGGGLMGPIVAAIIVVAGIAGVFNLMVVPALNPEPKKVPDELDSAHSDEGDSHGKSTGGEHAGDMKVPYELGDAILVNIRGKNNKVLSAKVGFLLKTTVEKDEEVKTVKEHLDKFKSMLVAETRGYFVGLAESDLNADEKVHRGRLKINLNMVFNKIRSYDGELGKHLKEDPVQEVYLPNFTHQ
ncbi:MAG: hypothetical protein QF913_07960 [Nitrospinaceae bacterium]|nr:hypothetical protein [Nitrospinaceae bacterium]